VTVNVPDIVESSLQYDLKATGLSFKAEAGGNLITYKFDIDFYKEIIPEESAKRLTSRALILSLRKKDVEHDYWPRLSKIKNPFIKTDFSKWVDEDEQEASGPALEEDTDMSGFGGDGSGFGGLGGGMDIEKMMAGMKDSEGAEPAQESDSDEDEAPPPLEKLE